MLHRAMTPSQRTRGGAIWAGLLVLGVGLGLSPRVLRSEVAAQTRNAVQAPMFEVDPFWPKPLPNHWVLGAAVGVWVDAQDHVWMVHRGDNPNTLKGLEMKPPFSEMCCATAPLVLEFDQKGNLLRRWSPGPNDPWMDQEHGIHIDHKNNVWLAGGGGGDSQILKYTMDGKFVMQVGKKGARLRAGAARPINDPDSLDMESFGQPTKIVVDPKTNEAYVSDGYVNHRVVVLDADSGKFKRVWGAYGNKPDDTPVLGPLNPHRGNATAAQPADRGAAHDPNAPPQQQFRNPVHCVVVSKDDLVYVCDRQGDRLQVFTKDGKFVKEKLIEPKTMNAGSVWDVALSSDPQQTFLYVADGENSLIHILRRDTLDILTAFGEGGRQPGQWHGVHNIATDSQGNIYTTETYEGKRIQKFTYKGLGPVTKPYQGDAVASVREVDRNSIVSDRSHGIVRRIRALSLALSACALPAVRHRRRRGRHRPSATRLPRGPPNSPATCSPSLRTSTAISGSARKRVSSDSTAHASSRGRRAAAVHCRPARFPHSSVPLKVAYGSLLTAAEAWLGSIVAASRAIPPPTVHRPASTRSSRIVAARCGQRPVTGCSATPATAGRA